MIKSKSKSQTNHDHHSYFKNKIFKRFAISIIFIAVFNITKYFTTVEQWIQVIRILPGTKIHPDIDYDVYEYIESKGFKYEKHFITTPDGYILQMVRLINPYLFDKKQNTLKPILLHHGFFCSAKIWLIAANGHLNDDGIYREYYDNDNQILTDGSKDIGNTLGFILSAKGYDVWLANYRGNIYSMNHTVLNVDDVEFWKFSMDEMIKYDLPTEIDYILNQTNQKSLTYIGHSQGSLMMFGLMSVDDEYAKKINLFISLSPVTYQMKITSIIGKFSFLKSLFLSYPNLIIFKNPARLLIPNICQNVLAKRICQYVIYLIVGMTEEKMIHDRIPLYMDSLVMGSAPWNIRHLYNDKPSFRYFDYGKEKNLQIYGQSEPPSYEFAKINSTKMALFYSKYDCLNHLDNVEKFKNTIQVKLYDDYRVPDEQTYDHNDYLWAKNSGKIINERILKLLQTI